MLLAVYCKNINIFSLLKMSLNDIFFTKNLYSHKLEKI